MHSAVTADLRQFGIKFCSHQHGKACPIQPDHQCNCCAKRAIGFIEIREMPKIDSEQIRQSDPAAHRKDRSR